MSDTPQPADEPTAAEPRLCPDFGTCHHLCRDTCFRVAHCAPLSGVYPDDTWPADVLVRHAPQAAEHHTPDGSLVDWTRHGHWIGDGLLHPDTTRPATVAQCGGPTTCPACAYDLDERQTLDNESRELEQLRADLATLQKSDQQLRDVAVAACNAAAEANDAAEQFRTALREVLKTFENGERDHSQRPYEVRSRWTNEEDFGRWHRIAFAQTTAPDSKPTADRACDCAHCAGGNYDDNPTRAGGLRIANPEHPYNIHPELDPMRTALAGRSTAAAPAREAAYRWAAADSPVGLMWHLVRPDWALPADARCGRRVDRDLGPVPLSGAYICRDCEPAREVPSSVAGRWSDTEQGPPAETLAARVRAALDLEPTETDDVVVEEIGIYRRQADERPTLTAARDREHASRQDWAAEAMRVDAMLAAFRAVVVRGPGKPTADELLDAIDTLIASKALPVPVTAAEPRAGDPDPGLLRQFNRDETARLHPDAHQG